MKELATDTGLRRIQNKSLGNGKVAIHRLLCKHPSSHYTLFIPPWLTKIDKKLKMMVATQVVVSNLVALSESNQKSRGDTELPPRDFTTDGVHLQKGSSFACACLTSAFV